MRRPLSAPLVAALAAALLVSGCSGSGGGDAAGGEASDTAATGASAPEPASPGQGGEGRADAAGPTGAEAAGGTGGHLAPLAPVDPARSAVVRTADLSVRVDDVRAAADSAGRLVRDAGGVVAAERGELPPEGDDAGGGRAELTLRVPTERFDELVARLAGLGEERHRSIGAEDVGGQVVDLEARLATQRASVERVRALLSEAENLGEVVQVEAELTRRIADLESLTARLEALRGRVELATIVLRLDTAAAAATRAGFLDGLRAGRDALAASGRVLAVAGGALLPFLPLLLVAGLVALRLRTRRRAPGTPASDPV